MNNTDTIAAPITPLVTSPVISLRISGSNALKVFSLMEKGGKSINISDITVILTFGLAPKAFINVCLVEDIDDEKIPNDHYMFMSKLSKIVSPMYNGIINTLLNNFDMKYDCCICGSYK